MVNRLGASALPFATLVATLLVSSRAHAAHVQRGGTVGNGGDSVYCQPSADNSFQGYMSSDFLLTLKQDNSDLVRLKSWEEYRDRLLALFDAKYPDFGVLFRDYLSRIPGESVTPADQIYMQQRVWLEAVYGLEDIKDEQIIRKLPPNCRQPSAVAGGGPQLTQTVIRQKRTSSIIYNYDPVVLEKLKQNPMQYSFLMVHEWLWDFLPDPEIIRQVNRFLHSNLLEKLPADEVRLSLENLGLTLKFRTFVPVCDRSPLVREYFEFHIGRVCTAIDEQTLINYGVDLQGRGLTYIQPGDLMGTSGTQVNLAGNQLTRLFEDVFFGMFKLTSINLGANRLRAIPPRVFLNTPALENLVLEDNELTELDFATRMPAMRSINLRNNRLTRFPIEIVKKSPSLGYLYLHGNSLAPLSPEDQDYLKTRPYLKIEY